MNQDRKSKTPYQVQPGAGGVVGATGGGLPPTPRRPHSRTGQGAAQPSDEPTQEAQERPLTGPETGAHTHNRDRPQAER